jgi:Tol biopolymer transport system component
MTVSTPPRPPSERMTPDSERLSRDEIEALVEALIEEARRETRRRRRKYWALAVLVTFVGVIVLSLLERGAASQTASPTLSARSVAAAGTPRSKIAFVGEVVRLRQPSWSELYVMNPDGSGRRRLLPRVWVSKFEYLAWSPDRRKLLFAAHLSRSAGPCPLHSPHNRAGYCKPEIFVINADGSGLRQLTRNTVADREPAWSPDGQKIAWTSRNDGTGDDVFVMNADGSDQQNLTPKPGNQGGPQWSPDGRAILFTAVPPGQPLSPTLWPHRGDVYVINADGSGQRNLTQTRKSGEFDPSWSPDGRIAFSRQFGGGVRILVMNADGGGKRAVTPKFARSGDRGLTGIWSPDGRRLAFDEDDAIYVINADGSGLHRLAKNAGFGDWSPDGRKIIFARRSYPKKSRPATAAQAARWAASDLWVMNADGSGQRNLTRTPTASDGGGATWAR